MYIGIDVGSQFLDIAASTVVPTLPTRVPNTADGITALVAALRTLAPSLIALEATGNYHRPVLAALLAAELAVAVVNPAQVVAFRHSRLGRHKSDRQDAKLLARFAELHHGELRQAAPDEPDLARLRAMVGYRDDLVARMTALRNQRHAAQWRDEATVVAWLEEDLHQVETRLREVETAIAALLATRPEAAVLTAQAGVGVLVAAAILAYLPAGVLGRPKAAAAYAGLHPRQTQSGHRDHSRLSKQGCPPLRRYLWLAALAAIRWDPELKAWHHHLLRRGKARKSAICAVAHKLLTRLMARVRDLQATPPEVWPVTA